MPAPTETSTPSPEPTATEATLAPDATATETLVPDTPVPTEPGALEAGLSESGPWLVYSAAGELIARNQDGSGRTVLSSAAELSATGNPAAGINILAGPAGGRIAVLVLEDPQTLEAGAGLHVIELPEGNSRRAADLINTSLDFAALGNLFDSEYRSALAAAPRWSPDGSMLAFLAALDNPSPDLYVFDVGTGEDRRLTDSGGISSLEWTPLGTHLLYAGSPWLEPVLNGRGLIPADKSAEAAVFAIGAGMFLDWNGPENYLVYSWNESEGNHFLRQIELFTGELRAVWPESFSSAVYEPASGTLALCLTRSEAASHGQSNAGLYLIKPDGSLFSQVDSECLGHLEWSPRLGGFVYYTNPQQLILLQGELLALEETFDPTLENSPNGFWRTRSNSSSESGGVWLASQDGIWLQYHETGVQRVTWRPDSMGFYFLDNAGALHQLTIGEEAAELVDLGTDRMIWVLP